MLLVPKGLQSVLTLVAVDLRGQRATAKLQVIDKYVAFARKYELVRGKQETELVEMLIAGVSFENAVAELREDPVSG